MRILLTTLTLFISTLLIAQAPALIPYQAVARDASGQPLANTNVNARFTIHHGSATGASVWQEMQTVSTSALGLFTVQLGSSMPLSGVNWSDGSKFMQVEIDLGSGFVDIGTQQLLSVPYALHSEDANRAGNGISDISQTGDTLYLANGNFVIVPGISAANYNPAEGPTAHSCGAIDVHNPNLVYGTMTDQQGNQYKTIVIGTQEWMAENLKTTIYRNGQAIPQGGAVNTGVWSYYGNDESFDCPYGKLYNAYAVNDPRQICPIGWHVPSNTEWNVLISGLNPSDGANPLMSVGLNYWPYPEGNTNSTGFSGLNGGGLQGQNGGPCCYPITGNYWTSTALTCGVAPLGQVDCNYSIMLYDDGLQSSWIEVMDEYRRMHYSVRCLRD